MVTEIANAKINLFLDVTGIREDGFHNIRSIMHSISLSDRLYIEVTPSDKVHIDIIHNSPELTSDTDNLVYKSALKYLSKFGINANIRIVLEKNIPIGAGLGGGSSDAAATLRGLNRIFKCADEETLLLLSAEIGSDVPFCLIGGTALCEGRGEIVTPLERNLNLNFVVAIGKGRISTPEAYRALDNKFNFCFGNGKTVNSEIDRLYNIFEQVVSSDEIDKIKEIMIKNGAESALMSGSGPSVFGIFNNAECASLAFKELKNMGFDAYFATSQAVNKVE